MKNSKIILIVLAIVAIALVAYYAGMNKKTIVEEDNIPETSEGIFIEREVEGNKEDLISFSVQPNQEVSGVLNFNGVIKNAYFFEANIGINILDENKNLLKSGYAMATGEWMTSGPVAFAGTIDLAGLPTGPGYLQIRNDNPSDRRDLDKFIYIPILIGQ
jgi:hypothetical protein